MEHDENHGFLACYRAMSVVSKVLAIGGFSVPLFACNALAGIEQPVDPGSDTGDANSAADQWVADVTNAPDEGTSVDHRLILLQRSWPKKVACAIEVHELRAG